jgi:S1/P1 Nuclease
MFTAPTQAWWNNGHMLVARVAQKELETHHPDVWTKVSAVHKKLETQYEQDHAFVESATFPDKFKYKGFKELGMMSPVSTFGMWHYVDTPYFNGVDEWPVNQSDYNVVNAINRLIPELKANGESDLAAYQMRCLIHYIGDIHQPLHAVSMYSDDFPKGDRGGNSFQLDQLNPKFKITELHALWDSVVTAYASDWSEPLEEDDWNTITDGA